MKSVAIAVPPVRELYPFDAVSAGLRVAGFKVNHAQDRILDCDFLVTWSPWKRSRREAIFLHYQRAGRPIIVMENGWLSPLSDGPYYQVAFNGWNGTGEFFPAGPTRWHRWGIRLAPWRHWKAGRDGCAVIIGQRGHPFDDRSEPPGWHERIEVPGVDEQFVIRRPQGCIISLASHLSSAAEVHVWTSNVATHALIGGVPVVHHGPNLMTAELCCKPWELLRRPDNRQDVFERLAWGQWSQAELASGEPFARLMDMAPA